MLDDIYNRQLLALAANIGRIGRLPRPDGSATVRSKLCGSTVTVDVRLDDEIVCDFAHEVKACALGQASSAIMAKHVVGSTTAELRALREAVHRMLKQDGPPPEGRWSEIEALTPVRAVKARHASTLLTFDAVVEAIDKALAAREASRALAAE